MDCTLSFPCQPSASEIKDKTQFKAFCCTQERLFILNAFIPTQSEEKKKGRRKNAYAAGGKKRLKMVLGVSAQVWGIHEAD